MKVMARGSYGLAQRVQALAHQVYRCARWIQVDYYIEYEPIFTKYYNIHNILLFV